MRDVPSHTEHVKLLSKPGYLQSNAYRLRGPDGCVLVDPGSGVQTEAILENLAAEGLTLGDIEAVLLTHYHCDHALSAPWYRAQGIPVMASAHTAAILERADSRIWGEHPELIEPCKVDHIIADGDTLHLAGLSIKAVATPGHTRGCLTFLVDDHDGLSAIVGDVLMPGGQPGWAGDEYSPEQLMESLVRLKRISPVRAYGGHSMVHERVSEWLERGLTLGRSGQWAPATHWQAQRVPEILQRMSSTGFRERVQQREGDVLCTG